MIEQIGERTGYVTVPSYFDVLRAFLLYRSELGITTANVVISGKESYCVLDGGLSSLPEGRLSFMGSSTSHFQDQTTTILPITNTMISRLTKIYNQLLLEKTRQ